MRFMHSIFLTPNTALLRLLSSRPKWFKMLFMHSSLLTPNATALHNNHPKCIIRSKCRVHSRARSSSKVISPSKA